MKYSKKILFAAGAFSFFSCSDINEMLPEGGALTGDQVLETTSSIPGRVAADVAGMYAYAGQVYPAFGTTSARHDDFGFPAACLSEDMNGADMVSDNSGYNWFSVASDYTDRTPNYANPYARYANLYNQIKLANDILGSIDPATEDVTLKQYMGQAKAVRAFDYLNLAPYFQFNYQTSKDKPCVPIVTEATADPANNPRATVEEVYTQIMSDLNDAITLLEGYTRPDKSKIDQQVAYGLRARANLYMGNWADAASDAEKAMVGYAPATIAAVSTPSFYNLNDPNWLWGILIEADKAGMLPSWPSHLGSFSAMSYTAGVGVYKRINPLLFDKIPSTDVRKGWWVDENMHSPLLSTISWNGVTGDAIAPLEIADIKVAFTPYTNVKFGMKSGIGSSVNDCDWPLMRVEEMIFIQAEGLAMSGNTAGAQQALENFIKANRDPSYTCRASTAEAIQLEVWKQRRIELWGEGFSMLDIMRLGKPVVRFHGNDIGIWPDAFAFNVASDNGYLLLRFPQSETNANIGIPVTENNEGTIPKSKDNPGLLDGVTD